jgi:uncharacterized protein YwqG
MDDPEDPLLREKLAAHRRTAWIPEVEDGAGRADGSRFGGAPWLRPGEAWPPCVNCGRPMQLFVQLNARDLPPPGARALEGGLMQFFYCTSEDPACEIDCEAWAPDAKSTMLRLIPRDDLGGGMAAPPEAGMFPARRITGWTERADYPNLEEAEGVGLELGDEETEEMYEDAFPLPGEKLMGWPLWVQGLEYFDCPECGTRMELLFQIDSEQNLPYMFGDMGIGHVTQCPRHRGQLAFGWACS